MTIDNITTFCQRQRKKLLTYHRTLLGIHQWMTKNMQLILALKWPEEMLLFIREIFTLSCVISDIKIV